MFTGYFTSFWDYQTLNETEAVLVLLLTWPRLSQGRVSFWLSLEFKQATTQLI